MRSGRVVEAISAGAAGAAIGGAFGSRLFGIGVPLAIVAGANGAISGWRGIYDWRDPKGVTAFVLDSTWAGLTTAAGVVANAVGMVQRDSGYSAALSERQR